MSSEGTAGGHEGVQKTPENTWNDETIRYQTAREIRREVMERIIDLGEIDGSYQQHIWMQELRTLFVRAESMIFFVGAGMSVQCGSMALHANLENGLIN